MARYNATILSQATQLSGAPVTTTVNGYMGYWGSSATSGFRLRRLNLGVIAGAGVPTSQQIKVGVYRQTIAPVGTGIAAAIPGKAMETWTPADPTAGLFAITAASIGTTGPTIDAQPLKTFAFNSQNSYDAPYELIEEIVNAIGTANGIAFVNLAATLPASHQINVDVEIEV
jgi:hypothetical protein